MHDFPHIRKNKPCCYTKKGGALMAKSNNELTKAQVQTTKLNKLPVPGEYETEFSAEEAAEVFEQNESVNQASENEE
jgi:hypothetical protein